MAMERAPVARRAVDEVLLDLSEAARRVDRMLERTEKPEQVRELTLARDALWRAHRAVGSQETTVRELGESVATLARELLESHARFSEWMRESGQAA